jgi:Skp family chaperone for outer membrane proteins
MMWTKKARYIISLSALACCLWLACVGTCSANPTYTISESELQTLETNLQTLEMHNATLKAILTTQDSELTEALNLLTKSQEELTKLKAELQIARQETQSAQNSLQIANEELAKASQSFKQYEKERDKVEGRLRNQRNIWEVLCAIAVGVAVAR